MVSSLPGVEPALEAQRPRPSFLSTRCPCLKARVPALRPVASPPASLPTWRRTVTLQASRSGTHHVENLREDFSLLRRDPAQ